mgnify:CR=1 FL=1
MYASYVIRQKVPRYQLGEGVLGRTIFYASRIIKQIASDLSPYEEREVDEHEDMHIRFPHLSEYAIRMLTKASLIAKGIKPKFH